MNVNYKDLQDVFGLTFSSFNYNVFINPTQ